MFKNLAKQGSFGEMIYSMFLEKHNIKFEKVNDKATDFLLYISDKMIRIDVKCSLSKKVWHNKNKEVKHLGIKYDVVFLDTKKNKAILFPDKNSPFYENYYDYELGDIDDFEKNFSTYRPTKKPIEKDKNKTNVKAEYRSYIKSELRDKTFDFDFLYRTSQTYKFHKNDPPHNVPGKILDKKSIIFSNMILDGERKKPGKSYILFSSEYKKYPYTGPTRNYHIKKGIEKLIDWSKFEELFPQNCHDTLEDLIHFLNTRNS